MKRKKSVGTIVLLVLGLLALAGASARLEAAEDGRLLMRYSPTLGMNVAIRVGIDGRGAGGFARGHVYERYLSPGMHRVTIRPNGRRLEEFSMDLFVRPNETYSYVVKFPRIRLALEPSGLPDR